MADKTNNLPIYLDDLHDAICNKKGYPLTQVINAQNFSSEIASIDTRKSQEKTVSPSTSQQVVSPDTGYNCLSKVTVNAITPTKGAQTYTPSTANQTIPAGQWLTGVQTILGDADLVAGNIKSGVNIFGVAGTYKGTLQSKTVTPSASAQTIKPDTNYTGLSQVTVNGDTDLIAGNIKKGVNIFGVTGTYEGTVLNLQSKTVNPSTSRQDVTPDTGYNGLSHVIVNAATLDTGVVSPKKEQQVVKPTAPNYGLSQVTVLGDNNLVGGNIKKGVSIFGVAGTYEGGDDFNLKTRYQAAFSPASTTTFKFTVAADSTDTVELLYGAKTVTLGDGESAQIDIGGSYGYYKAISVYCTDYVYELEISISNKVIMRINISVSNVRGFVLVFHNGYLYITSTEEIYVE